MTTHSYSSRVRPIGQLAIVAIGFALVSIGSTHCKALSGEGTGDPRLEQLKIPNSVSTSLPASPIHMIESKVVDLPFGYRGDLERAGMTPIHTYSCPLLRTETEKVGGRSFPFGISNGQVEHLINYVCVAVYSGSASYIPNQSNAEVAGRLLSLVDSILVTDHLTKCPKFLRQWLLAEAICAWILTEFGPEPPSIRYENFNAWWVSIQPENILRRENPYTACAGSAMLAKALASELTKSTGIECDYVGGWLKDQATSQVPKLSNHSWNVFRFDQGIVVPADCVPTADAKSWKRKWKDKQFGDRILPLNRECLEIFLALRWGAVNFRNDNEKEFKLPLVNPISTMSLDQWRTVKLPPSFRNLIQWGNAHPFN